MFLWRNFFTKKTHQPSVWLGKGRVKVMQPKDRAKAFLVHKETNTYSEDLDEHTAQGSSAGLGVVQ